MYQFGRLLTMRGDARETMAWAAEVTAFINDRTDVDVLLWSGEFGYPVGTVAWSAIVEGRAQLSAETEKFVTDEAYLDLVSRAQDWVVTPAHDVFRRIVHGDPGAEPPAVGNVASITAATAATGKLPEAMAWAVDMATYATSVTGVDVSLGVNAYGAFGGMAFISVVPDMAAADASSDKLTGDSGYPDRIAASAGLFVDGSAHASALRRIA